MGENITRVLIVLLVVLGNVVLGVESSVEESELIEVAQNYKFSTSTYSCTLHKTGMILYLKAYGKNLLKSVILFGDVVYNKKRARVLQNAKAKTWKLVKSKSESNFIVTGDLFSRSKKILANFKQNVILTPKQIKCSYEVTTTEALKIKRGKPFFSLLSAPIANYLENAMYVIDKKGDESIWEIQKVFQKKKETFPLRLQSASFSLGNGDFSIIIPPNEQSWMRINDARAWKSPKLEILVMPIIQKGPRRDVIHPAGTVFKWKFTLDFN